MPSPTDSTCPTSETSASWPKLAIWVFRMAEISAARMSMALRSLEGELEGIELRLQRSIVKARAHADLEAAENGGVDAGFDFGVAAQAGAQGGLQALGLGGRQGDGGGDLGGDDAAVGDGQGE